jgi:hypothetical protein
MLPLAAQAGGGSNTQASPADVRETSPLHAYGEPFDFAQKLDENFQTQTDRNPEDELAQRKGIREEARWLFITSDSDNLDKLEALFEDYRSKKARTDSGVWKLTQAYGFLRNLDTDWTRKKDPAQPDWIGEKLGAWKAKHPQSPTPHIFEAAIINYRATAILRDRLARSTYPGGAEALNAELKKARDALLAAKDVASKDPYYYALMAIIMRNQRASADEVLQAALEGIERYPDYFDTYFEATVAIGNLSRRPLDDLEALANTALQRTQATLGDEIYARIYWNAIQTIVENGDLGRLKWNWTRMKASMQTVSERYPVQWNIQNFAMFACFMSDAEATRSFLTKAKGQPLATVWSQSEVFDACQQFAQAQAQPQQPETRKANAP